MNAWRVIQNIGLVTLVGVSLTCDSNTKTLSSTIKNQKSDIENVLTLPIDSNIVKSWTTKHISDTTSPQIIDTLAQWDILHQQKNDTMNSDAMQIVNINPHNKIIDTTERWANNNIVIWDITSKENTKKILSQEECNFIMKSQLKKAVEEIVVETDELDFDVEYMRSQVWLLLKDFFSIQDSEDWLEIKFMWIKDEDKKNITNYMDKIRSHIKTNNWILVKIFLTKSKLREFTKENIPVVYKILTKDGTIEYTWGEKQFTIDINNIINTYK